MNRNISEIPYFNKIIDKSQLKKLITWAFRNYGTARASYMVDQLKDLGFYYATKAGISLSLEDLRIPPSKQHLLNMTLKEISTTDRRYKRGEITAVERFQKVIDTWNYASEHLKSKVIQYFKETDPLNSIYMMAFSGARANISQVRQLVGMRGLMADPQGQIIDLPIANNFREGLTVTDYFISSYGARKGLVDTALRTADSGYLTRRLVDVAQDVIIREYDCKTAKGVLISEMIDNQSTLISLQEALLGRVLAEDLIDLKSGVSLATSGQSIDPLLLNKIMDLKLYNVLVRSPLTCASTRSVCQLCYGWNLAHGKMVDLGEAVGIIAAQSIGEPGTQLTMRTFHTGGVFTGELEKNIVSKYTGHIQYDSNIILSNTRTKHGDYALLVHNDSILRIMDSSLNICKQTINLTKGSLLLVDNHVKISEGQIVAQYPLNNRLSKEKAQKTIVTDFAGTIHFHDADYIVNNRDNRSDTVHSLYKNTIIWVLSGQVYDIPNETKLMISNNQIVYKGSLVARTELVSRYNGLIHLIRDFDNLLTPKILLITSLKSLKNCKVWMDDTQEYKNYILEVSSKDKFILKNIFNQRITHNCIIADLISNTYKTKTGGIIKYLDISIVKNKLRDSKKDIYDINGSGYILWISEETHIINKDISLLLVQHGQFVDVGTEILPNVFVTNNGILEVIEKDGIVREVIIKQGILHALNSLSRSQIHEKFSKSRGFLRPGEQFINNIVIDKLSYWEYMTIDNKEYVLVRPVIVYAVPNKCITFDISEDSFEHDIVNLKLIRRTQFRDGERVKSIAGIHLIHTHLIVEVSEQASNLKCSMQLEPQNDDNNYFYLKFITADLLFIKDSYFINNEDLYTQTHILVQENDFINKGSVIAQTNIFSDVKGQINYIQNQKTINRRILIVSSSNTLSLYIDNNNPSILVKIGSWVYSGDCVATNTVTPESGQVIAIKDNQIVIRIGQPYLISKGSFLHISNKSLVKRGENIATLIYERSKTGDIVQGLPRIEEILEARKKIDSSFNPHFILDTKFKFYIKQGLNAYDATRQSFLDIQLFLVKEVQLVYQSQGVDIADKHIEVIIRQMTSKVKIENGGDTNYLPGEIVELKKVESINKALFLIGKIKASYYPVLLGITKASLNTESFISAASFQETTKVLTEAAISGKLDWLRGLKENVIIGRLIPAGTGFNAYQHNRSNPDIPSILNSSISLVEHDKTSNLTNIDQYDDIIVDDRNMNLYPFFYQ